MITLHPDGTRTEGEADLSGFQEVSWFTAFEGAAVTAWHDPTEWENPEGGMRHFLDEEGAAQIETVPAWMPRPVNEQASQAWYAVLGARIGDTLRGDVVIVPNVIVPDET